MGENVKQRPLQYDNKMRDQQQVLWLVKRGDDFKVEDRKAARKQFFMQVDYASKDKFHNDFIDNISSSGLFIQTKSKFRVGDELTILLSLPNNSGNLKLKGEVVRVTKDGIGVKYENSPYLKDLIVEKLNIE